MTVERIGYEQTKPFLLNIHYARRMPSISYAYGLIDGGIIKGVVTYGSPASPSLCKGVAGEEHRKDVLELNRLALLPDLPKNSASQLISKSLKMLPKGKIIVSYADWGGWHHVGYVYQATNWMYTGMTKPRTDKYSESGHSRHYAEGEKRRQIRTAKHRYVYVTDKRLKKDLKYPVLKEYPKGDSRHYDITNPIPVISTHEAINDRQSVSRNEQSKESE